MVCVEAARCRYRCCLARCVGVFRALDQKVVNFEQILFANGRRLNLTEGASAWVPYGTSSSAAYGIYASSYAIACERLKSSYAAPYGPIFY
jgi:hypothetical protein